MCPEVLVAKKILNEKISFSQCKYIRSLLSTKISGPEVINLTITILVEVFLLIINMHKRIGVVIRKEIH